MPGIATFVLALPGQFAGYGTDIHSMLFTSVRYGPILPFNPLRLRKPVAMVNAVTEESRAEPASTRTPPCYRASKYLKTGRREAPERMCSSTMFLGFRSTARTYFSKKSILICTLVPAKKAYLKQGGNYLPIVI